MTISNIAFEICHKLQVFCSVQLSHVRPEGNKLAHILAQYSKGLDSFVTWVKDNLVITEFAMTQDVLNLSLS